MNLRDLKMTTSRWFKIDVPISLLNVEKNYRIFRNDSACNTVLCFKGIIQNLL